MKTVYKVLIGVVCVGLLSYLVATNYDDVFARVFHSVHQEPGMGYDDTDYDGVQAEDASFVVWCNDADSDADSDCYFEVSGTYSGIKGPIVEFGGDGTGNQDRQPYIRLVYGTGRYAWFQYTGEYRTQLGGSSAGLELAEDHSLFFEGATDDGNEGKLTTTDPTGDPVWTLPDDTGNIVITGAAVTNGTCAYGDTDNASFDTGTEVCADIGLTCHGALEMDGTELADADSDGDTCDESPSGTATDGWFMALCY